MFRENGLNNVNKNNKIKLPDTQTNLYSEFDKAELKTTEEIVKGIHEKVVAAEFINKERRDKYALRKWSSVSKPISELIKDDEKKIEENQDRLDN